MISDTGQHPRWHVGFVGFAYPEWNGTFYPTGLPARDRLAYVSRKVNAVEINTSFYAVPDAAIVRRWAETTPPEFRFCLKMIRDVTHGPTPAGSLASSSGPPPGHFELESTREAAARLLRSAAPLSDRLGAVLLQFPPVFRADRHAELLAFLHNLPRLATLAVEFRHSSWRDPAILNEYAAIGVTIVARDDTPHTRIGGAPSDLWAEHHSMFASGNLLYLRWLGRHGQFPDRTRERVDPTPHINWWLERIREALAANPQIRDVFIFLDNDFAGHAPTTARRLCEMLHLAPCGAQAEDAAPRSLFDHLEGAS